MRHRLALFTAVLLLLFLGGFQVARGDDPPAATDLTKIQPPGGVPLNFGKPGEPISTEAIRRATQRLEAAPEEEMAKWVAELKRITGKKLDGELEEQGCRTYFVSSVSLAFVDDSHWNARVADTLLQRARSIPASEAAAWKQTFEALLGKEIDRPYAVPLVLIPLEALHEGQKYSAERGRKYLARLKQLTREDVSLWRERVDKFGGTDLDAAVNIVLLDPYFDQEKFQRDRFRAAVSR